MGVFFIFPEEGEAMRIEDHLSKEQIRQLNKMAKNVPKNKQSKPEPKKKKQEKVNWIEIMGMNRDRFGRGRGGAMKRK
jgi:Mn-dependent DtxR family transcriptional regulator